MFCGNCGSNIQNGINFCPNCGKNPNKSVVIGNNSSVGEYPLINLSAKLFTVFFEIGLWLILIGGPIAGGIIGGLIGRRDDGILPGIIIGFIIGFILMIFSGGITAVLLKIKNNTDRIK